MMRHSDHHVKKCPFPDSHKSPAVQTQSIWRRAEGTSGESGGRICTGEVETYVEAPFFTSFFMRINIHNAVCVIVLMDKPLGGMQLECVEQYPPDDMSLY